MIGQVFVQIYPHPACAPMHAHFAESYRAAAQPEIPMRKPAVLAAVA